MRIQVYGTNHKVTLNDCPLQDVLWADPDTGECEIWAHDREGQRIPDSDNINGYQTLLVKGKVTVEQVTAPSPPSTENPWPYDYSMGGCMPC